MFCPDIIALIDGACVPTTASRFIPFIYFKSANDIDVCGVMYCEVYIMCMHLADSTWCQTSVVVMSKLRKFT